MSELVLDVRGVRRTFEAENAPVRALRGTDFQMDRGEFVAIMGPSGCGKSTLLNLIAGVKRKPAESRARDLLDLLGLGDKARQAPATLSGGQRQRLAIARALANEPTLLLADEPTGALDSEGGQEVIELFRRLHASGQTILMVTHDDDVAAAAQRVARMKDGKVISTNDEALAGASSTSA